MGDKSAIEWTDASWNPVTGCTEVSPGCDHCYAKVFAERWRGIAGHPYEQGFDLRLWEERLDQPLRWKRPRRIFVNSMSDLFHKDVPDEFIGRVFEVMNRATQHQFQVLTKRPQRMARMVSQLTWTPNIWQGVTIENDAYTWRADWLRKVPASVRFVSAEPLLSGLPSLSLEGIHWVIVGGESGHGARPMHPKWAQDLRDRCQAAGAAYFFKQWGVYVPVHTVGDDPNGRSVMALADGTITDTGWNGGPGAHLRGAIPLYRAGKKDAGRLLDGREWNEYPQPLEVTL